MSKFKFFLNVFKEVKHAPEIPELTKYLSNNKDF